MAVISSLGAGSGVLTPDKIDIYKNAEIGAKIVPMTKKIDKLKEQEEAMTNLITLTATLKTAVVDLSDEAVFEKRKVTVNGNDLTVQSNDGVAVQDMEIKVNQLAKIDINQSKGFDSETSSVVDSDTSMTIDIDGDSYDIDVKSGTTLEELRDKINEATEGKVIASILNTGGDKPYSLILKSSETGANQAITVTYGDTDGDGTANENPDDDFLGLNNVQTAQDAEFVYNGITINRSKNLVDDLIVGVKIELTGDSGESNYVSIKQDKEAIADMIDEFVQSYNAWNSKIAELTKFDPDGKSTGVFQGDSTIRMLQTDVKDALFDSSVDSATKNVVVRKDENGNTTGVDVYDANFRGMLGIEVNQIGILTFDRSEFLEEFDKNSQKLQDDVVARFGKLNESLKRATDSNSGYLKNYEDQLKREEDSLTEQKDSSLKFIDKKYEIMAMQFAAYDKMISDFNAQYGALQMAIDTQLASK